MPLRRLSDIVGASHQELEDKDVYDNFIDIDTALHIDPHLLEHSTIPEMQQAYANFGKYWSDTFKLVGAVNQQSGITHRAAGKRFIFPEIREASLGYAKNNNQGSAIGKTLARQIHSSAEEVLRLGINDPTFFELIGLFESGIGADRISDISLSICLPEFLSYTARICIDLSLKTDKHIVRGIEYLLPRHPDTGVYLIFFPKSVLRDLPTAFDVEEIESVIAKNESLRRKLAPTLIKAMHEARDELRKSKRREILLSNPELLKLLIEEYKNMAAVPYDFASDIAGERVWLAPAEEAAKANPLDLSKFKPLTANSLKDLVLSICDKYRELIENNGLWKILYDDTGKPRKGKVAQMLFFVVADSYARSNGVDVSPESNRGPGPVDFKFSFGSDSIVLVEIKLSTHKGLLKGFEKQLPKYAAAEKSHHDILLIVRNNVSLAQIKGVEDSHGLSARNGKKVPFLKVIDGRPQNSASK